MTRVLIYPADDYACGKIRLIWPGQMLAEMGHDVIVEAPEDRRLRMYVDQETQQVTRVQMDPSVDVVIFQRPTHAFIAQAIPTLREQGVAVVVDVDDDMHTIHPDNPAWIFVHPQRHRQELRSRGWKGDIDKQVARLNATRPYMHSRDHLDFACRHATVVTVSTPSLLHRYARHGRGIVLWNYLADHYYGHERRDSALVGWPASLHSHPNDPAVVGNAFARLASEQVRLVAFGTDPVGRAFGVSYEPELQPGVGIDDWPAAIAELGIAICPLADTTFNRAKSWLKPLECAAVGVPWVASPRAEYARLHGRGCGLLAERPKDWYRVIRELVRSESQRAELAAAGRAVAAELSLRRNVEEYLEVWEKAAAAR